MLETSECIFINSNGRKFTDCMEFSLLRFAQMLLFDKIDDKYSNYKKDFKNQYFTSHIQNNKKIYHEIDYYLNSNERNEWALCVSDKDFFDYYRNDKAELFTSVKNILIFLEKYFEIKVNFENPQETFNNISKYFSNENKNISISINDIKEINTIEKMKYIINYVSRPDCDYDDYYDETFDVINKETLIDIYINDYQYQWYLYEKYIDTNDENKIYPKNKFITGHSVINQVNF